MSTSDGSRPPGRCRPRCGGAAPGPWDADGSAPPPERGWAFTQPALAVDGRGRPEVGSAAVPLLVEVPTREGEREVEAGDDGFPSADARPRARRRPAPGCGPPRGPAAHHQQPRPSRGGGLHRSGVRTSRRRRRSRLLHAHACPIGRSLLAGLPGSLTLTPSPRPAPRRRRGRRRSPGVPASVRRAASPVARIGAVERAHRRRRRTRAHAARRARHRLAGVEPADEQRGVALVDRDRAVVALPGRDRDQAAAGERVVEVALLVARLDAVGVGEHPHLHEVHVGGCARVHLRVADAACRRSCAGRGPGRSRRRCRCCRGARARPRAPT